MNIGEVVLDVPDEILKKIAYLQETGHYDDSLEKVLLSFIEEGWLTDVRDYDFDFSGIDFSREPLTSYETFLYKFDALMFFGSVDYNIIEVKLELENDTPLNNRRVIQNVMFWSDLVSPEFREKYSISLVDPESDKFKITEEMYTSGDLKREFERGKIPQDLIDFIFS